MANITKGIIETLLNLIIYGVKIALILFMFIYWIATKKQLDKEVPTYFKWFKI